MEKREFDKYITKNNQWLIDSVTSLVKSSKFTKVRNQNPMELYSILYEHLIDKDLYKRIEREDHFKPFILNSLKFMLMRQGVYTYNLYTNYSEEVNMSDSLKDILHNKYIYLIEDEEEDYIDIIEYWSTLSKYNTNLYSIYLKGGDSARKLSNFLDISQASTAKLLAKMREEIYLLYHTDKDYNIINRYVNYIYRSDNKKKRSYDWKEKIKKTPRENPRGSI